MANVEKSAGSLKPRSPFTDFKPLASANLSIEQRDTLTIASVAARKGQDHALAAAVKTHYGVELSSSPKRVDNKGVAFVWAGPGLYLAMAERTAGRDLETELKAKLGGLASIADQSDGRAVLRISGTAAREALAKGLPIDLHPRAFKSGDVATTHASHIGVTIWQIDDAPTYEIALFRSFAGSFWHWLKDAAVSVGART